MNPITYYIKQALADYYPDSEAASLAKLLLTQVFGFTVIERSEEHTSELQSP